MRLLRIVLPFLLTGLFACNNSEPVKEAKKRNLEIYDVEAFDMTDEALFIVDLSNYFQASSAMSEIAVENATEEEVKRYARDIITSHHEMQNRIRAIAGRSNLALPAEPSESMQEKIEALKKKEPIELSRAYLDHMEDIHLKIGKKADALVSETELEPFLELAREMSSLQFRHLERAQQLQESIYPTEASNS